jgi:hypothetical protein
MSWRVLIGSVKVPSSPASGPDSQWRRRHRAQRTSADLGDARRCPRCGYHYDVWFQRSREATVLKVLDRCAAAFTFPVLDNGYVYLAATRLTLHRSAEDWAIVIEVFGFSPRAGLPDIAIYSFGSRLQNRNTAEQYVSPDAYEKYVKNNPNNEMRSAFPVAERDWQDEDNTELLEHDARTVLVRGTPVALPPREEYARYGIALSSGNHVHVFELARFLAATHRNEVLATPGERRASVAPELDQLLLLDEWNHPDVAGGVRPSASETFRQLARVLDTGDVREYRPMAPSNTHWSNWPEGGLL